MIQDVVLKKLQRNEDERGWLAEIFRADDDRYNAAMGYVSVTNPGVVRGPHEHSQQSDFFVFLGPGSFKLFLWDRRESSSTKGERIEIEVGENNPTAVLVPPGVVHGYKCVSEIPAWCINLPDKLYRGIGKQEEVDEIRWEKDPASPFKID